MKRLEIALLTAVIGLLLATGTRGQEEPPPQPDPRAGVFADTLPYESQYAKVLGARMHYVEKGEGQIFLFLHGNPTSSYLWRNVMRYVESAGHVIAVDNIGFGKSDKPDLDYTYQTHSRYIDGFIEVLGLRNLVLVMHDWGSILGLDYARRHADNVRGVVFMEAIIPPTFPMASVAEMGPGGELFRRFRTPDEGRTLLIDQNVFVEQLLANGAITRQLSPTELEAYREPFRDPQTRYPIYVWPNELPIGGHPARNVDVIEAVGRWLRASKTPKLLQYASPGAIYGPEQAAWAAANFRNLEIQFVGYGAHYIQEDNPEAIGRGIAEWYRRIAR